MKKPKEPLVGIAIVNWNKKEMTEKLLKTLKKDLIQKLQGYSHRQWFY